MLELVINLFEAMVCLVGLSGMAWFFWYANTKDVYPFGEEHEWIYKVCKPYMFLMINVFTLLCLSFFSYATYVAFVDFYGLFINYMDIL